MRCAGLVLLVLLLVGPMAAAESAAPRESLLQALSAETVDARDDAQARLERAEGLTQDEVRAALGAADRRARPHLFRVAAARGMQGLAPDIAKHLTAPDPVTSDAAARALVSLGDEAVAKGREALSAEKGPEADAARTHLEALFLQRMVEHEVLSRWRRKGGTYEGRYSGLSALGWPVQPILLAMLLDIPLRDHHIVLRAAESPGEELALKLGALHDIYNSDRRGYRTFEPLPARNEPDDLFELAYQALKDVGDVNLMGSILADVSEELKRSANRRFRPRAFEKIYYQKIDEILFSRGRPMRLKRNLEECLNEVERARNWARTGRPEASEMLSTRLADYAGVLHQMHRFAEAARVYEEIIGIGIELGGKVPAIAGYNRACAFAKAGRKDEALAQLEQALDPELASGFEDLTKEWVTEDGDLESLHDDPRFEALIRRVYRGK